MEGITNFVKTDGGIGAFSVSSSVCGSGGGNRLGCGCGIGNLHGYGSSFSCGYGGGVDCGNSDITGGGNGKGKEYFTGSGECNGDGNGNGGGFNYANGIKRINKETVYEIDNVLTLIYKVKGSVANGAVLNNDLSITKCFIVKQGEFFSHGETLKKALESLQDQIYEYMPIDERIDAFLKEFDLDKKYPAMKYFVWHHKLTNSCEMGRKLFAKSHDIDLENDTFTVKEFIDATKNDFGVNVILQLESRIKGD